MATLPQWPAELPRQFLLSTHSERAVDGRLWPNRESGGAPRLSTPAHIREISGTLLLLDWQRARLERFWAEETVLGVKTFIVADPFYHEKPIITEGLSQTLTESGSPLVRSCWRRARFAPGGLSWTMNQFAHVASITLMIYNN